MASFVIKQGIYLCVARHAIKVSWDPKVSWIGGQLGPSILRPQLAERRRREASCHECPRLGPAGRRPARA